MKKSILTSVLITFLTLAISACTGARSQITEAALSKATDTPAVLQPTPTISPTDTPTTSPTQAPAPTELPSPTPSTQAEIIPSATPTQVPSPTPADMLPSPTPEVQSASAQSNSPNAQACSDKASFSDDVTIPDGTLVHIGETFTKTWKIRNEGTCDWNGYSLIYAGGEAMNSPMSVLLQEIKPGEFADISVQLQAPDRGGAHTGYWEFKNAAGQSFGVGAGADGLIWTQIVVDYPTPEAVSPTPTAQDSTSQTATSQSSSSQNTTSQASASQTTETNPPPGSCAYTPNSDYENQIVSLVNDARVKNGLAPLTLDSKLSAAALVHSVDMACNDIVSHSGSDGSSWYDRVKAQGFANYTSTRENIYVGNPAFGGDAQGAFTWWMNSKIHHDNILYPTVTAIGVGYAYTSTSSYGGYYTLELARK